MKHTLRQNYFETVLSIAKAAQIMDVSEDYLNHLYQRSEGPPPISAIESDERRYLLSDLESWLSMNEFFNAFQSAF